MSHQERINSSLIGTQQNIAQELMEEDLKRELERNEIATKMAMAKEQEAQEAKRRAQEAQVMMNAMMQKYEEMKDKLDSAKTALAETATRTQQKEEIIEKIQTMKERIEKYSDRKEAVNYLQDHVQMKFDHHANGLEFLNDCHTETEKYQKVQQAEEEKAERVKHLQGLMKEREKALEKTSQIKVMLERQLEIGEKRAAEQNRIATVREKLLELKMKELELQKAKLARKKKEQEEKERATEDFITMIDKQLEEMENNKSTNPKQKTEALSAILEKHFSDQEKKENSSETGAIPKTPKDEVSKQETTVECVEKIKSPEPVQEISNEKNQVEESVDEILKDSEPKKSKNKKKNKNKNKNKQPLATPLSTEQKNTSPEPEKEKEKTKSKTVEKTAKTAEQIKKEVAEYLNKSRPVKNEVEPSEETKEVKLTEEEVKNMVAKVEDKCQNVRDDIADMAMSEQYLRTKQAMLKAKKKEQEMEIAQKMASIRETEVLKMREKVAKMQELLHSRKTELKITEEIIHEKDGAKRELDKRIEASMRRQSYVEKKMVEKVMFEKPRKKK